MLLAVAVIWGVAGPVIKLTLTGLSPLVFITYRFLISALLALPIIFIKRHFFNKNLFLLIIYGFLNSTATLGLLFLGTSKTTLLDMSLISLFGPILMILLGFIFLKDHITTREKIGIIIAFIGSSIIALEPLALNSHGNQRLLGNLLIFGSLVCGAVSGLLTKKLLRLGHDPLFLTNFSFVIGFLTLLPFVFVFYSPFSIWHLTFSIEPKFHLGVLYMALVSGTLAYYLSAKAQKTIELSEQAVFAYIHPSISAVFAVLLLGDKITPQLAIGGIIAIIGVAVAEIKKKRYNP